MRRRDALKGLSILAGAAIQPASLSGLFGIGLDAKAAKTPIASPVRALVNKDGRLLQPIQINFEHRGPEAALTTRLDGKEVDRRTVAAGSHSFQVLTSPVTVPRTIPVELEIQGRVSSIDVKLQPVRRMNIYILPHSHHDLGYTDLQANVEEKQMHNISRGIELARETADYPEGARFVWNLEVLWGADLFLRRRSPAEIHDFIEAIKSGWLALNGMYANELTGLCRPEELLRLFSFGVELGERCGVPVTAAMLSDVPGFTWGTVTAMSQAGIRYFSAAPNYFDRIGTFMVEWQDKPFWWLSPSGKEKVLVWVPWTGYAMSHIMKLSPEWVGKYQDRLDSVRFPYDISYIRWSGHGDNAEPDPELPEFIKGWNEQYEWPKFSISSTHTAFSNFERRHGKELPEFRGDLTPYWEDGAGSSALETAINRNSADRLTQAEALSAMLAPGTYNAVEFREAWRNVLLYSEHTWGAWCSVSDSENPFTKKQWAVKRAFAVDAETESEALLQRILENYQSKSSNSSAVDVHNSTSWPRTDLVIVSKDLSAAGDRVEDERGQPVPSQRLSTGELAFVARGVPPLATARFHISGGKPHRPEEGGVSFHDDVLENNRLSARIDPETGDITQLSLHGSAENLVDRTHGEDLNEFLFLQGNDTSKLQRSGRATIRLEEAGPLVAVVRVESDAPGCNSLVRRVHLVADSDWIALENIVDKKRAPLNPHPGQGGPAEDFAQHGAKESVQFAFPFAIANGTMRINIPLAVMRPETDQLPGSCKNWLEVGRWIDVSNASHGVTWASLDAPLVEVGAITANLLGSQRDPSVWRKHIGPTQKFYSWVMNNHWGTNYRAYQEGVVKFRYAVRLHGSQYDQAEASRFATGMSQPLVACAASSERPRASLFQVEPADVLVVGLKPSKDGKAWIIRLFGASGQERRAKLIWGASPPSRLSLSDTSEAAKSPVGPEILVPSCGLITLRADH